MDARIVSNQVINSLQISVLKEVPSGNFNPGVNFLLKNISDDDVAINSQYHDYVELFKSWFGDNVDQKIIESAIIFWFKDVDCKSRNKVVSYFKEY